MDTNSPFQFQKSGQLIIRVRDEALTVVVMCVCNPDRVRPLESIAEKQPQLPTGFAQIVSDDLPVLHLIIVGFLILLRVRQTVAETYRSTYDLPLVLA